MYIYRVGYYSHEESPQTYLVHELKFEPEEFDQLVFVTLEEIIRKWLTLESTWWGPSHIHIPSELDNLLLSVEYLLNPLVEALISKRGFKRLEAQATVNFDGWADLYEHAFGDITPSEANAGLARHLISQGITSEMVTAQNEKLQADNDRRWEEHQKEEAAKSEESKDE